MVVQNQVTTDHRDAHVWFLLWNCMLFRNSQQLASWHRFLKRSNFATLSTELTSDKHKRLASLRDDICLAASLSPEAKVIRWLLTCSCRTSQRGRCVANETSPPERLRRAPRLSLVFPGQHVAAAAFVEHEARRLQERAGQY